MVAWFTSSIGRETSNATFVAFKVSSSGQGTSRDGIGIFVTFVTSARGPAQEGPTILPTCTTSVSLGRYGGVATSLRSTLTETTVASLAVDACLRTIFQERNG